MNSSTRDRAMSFPPSPVRNNLFKRRSVVSLDIIVVGAGLSGLSAAYNLRQAGHNVRVLEKKKGAPDLYSGVFVPPNMSKLLLYWGLGEQLASKAVKCPQIDFVDGATGTRMSTIVYHPELMKELQADPYNIKFRDLYDMIFEICISSGVVVEFDAQVVEVDPETPAVLLADGQMLDADLIVGADGASSIVRKNLDGGDQTLEYGRFATASFLVPVSEMEKDPLLAPLAINGKWSTFVGSNDCYLCYRVSPEDYLVAYFAENTFGRDKDSWTLTVTKKDIRVSEYGERVRRLVALGKEAVLAHHVIPPQMEDWFSDDGRLVLVGDSIHPHNPHSTSGSALSVEDGAVLGSLFSRLQTHNRDEIIRLLRAYQEIRQERCETIVKTDTELAAFCSLPPGPARDARDEGFAQSEKANSLDWGEQGEDLLRGAWEEFRSSFGYEAYDAADDWWVDWGVMVQRIGGANTLNFSVSTAVSTSVSVEESTAGVFGASHSNVEVRYE